MRYPVEQTAARHERILREASRLLRQYGLDGVSVPQIMKAARLTHGPFYNHFEPKDALVAESIDRAIKELLEHVSSFAPSSTGRLQFLDHYPSTSHRDNPGAGCPIAALAGDAARNLAAKVPFTKRLNDVFSAIASSFFSSRKENARGDAIRLMAQIVGALVLARAVEDNALSEEILVQTRA